MAFITEWLQPIGNFTLPLRIGYTYNMVVDWGDGSATSTVTAYNAAEATHDYTVAGTYQISITGTCGAWYINNSATTKLKLTKVIEWGDCGFTGAGLQYAFYGCSNLILLPVGSITGANSVTNYVATFRTCVGLTSLPTGLFNNNVSIGNFAFQNTFNGCTGLTSIPTDLFRYQSGAAISAFENTFNECSGLTSLPPDLFKYNIHNSVIFNGTFNGCSGLTSLPIDLFRYNTGITTNAFNLTFNGCSGLTSLPTDLFRYNINAKISSTFKGCIGLTSLPTDLFRYNTGNDSFYSVFSGCIGLTSLPIDLFRYNVNVSSFAFYNTFYGCTGLTSLPPDLFRYNINAIDFSSCFYGCTKLTLNKTIFFAAGEESTRFLNKSVNFSNCFYRTSFNGTIGEAPEIWNCNFGTGTPTKTSCFSGTGNSRTTILNYCYIPSTWGASRCARLESYASEWYATGEEKITVTTPVEIGAGESISCYVSNSLTDIENVNNIVNLTSGDNKIFQGIALTPADGTTYYIRLKYSDVGGANPETIDFTKIHYQIQPIQTTIINVTDTNNHITFNTPLSRHSYNHGSLFLNGYIFGSARNLWNVVGGGYISTCLFKLKANDYSDVQQRTYYLNQNAPDVDDVIASLEQIVFCKGFIWAMGDNYGQSYLLRVDPVTLAEVIFITAANGTQKQPIGTDGNYLFLSDNTTVKKYDTDLLLGTAASYNYTGDGPVALPANTVLGSCAVNQIDATKLSYVHSINVDADFIFLAVTYCPSAITGWNATLSQYSTSFQKINKATMTSVSSVGIPACTDDMVQNSQYVFLCPEIANTAVVFPGTEWGLLAINKSTLEIKFLKALHADFNTVNESDRAGYGVFIFNDKISVQLINSKKTVIITTDNVTNWGETFPIGGATTAIYKFQINGVDLLYPCNELVMDDAGYIHTNTWEEYTQVFKFTTNEIFPEIPITYNSVTLSHNNTIALLALLDGHNGHSIRCVQAAPGVPTGTTGTATDQDGNIYDTIVINEKRWMIQNLKATHYRNGDPIANITDATAWQLDAAGAWCSYQNKPSNI